MRPTRLAYRWRRQLERRVGQASRAVLLWGWTGYIVLVVAFAAAASLYLWQVRGATRDQLVTRLAAAEREAVVRFEGWMDQRVQLVRTWADAEDTRQLVRTLLSERDPAPERLDALQAAFRARFALASAREGMLDYFIVSPAGITLGSLASENAGTPNLLWREPEFVRQMKERGAAVSPFMTSDVAIHSGLVLDDKPITMFVGVPIRLDGAGEPSAYFTLRVLPIILLAE